MRIRFGVPSAQPVTLEICDLLGRRVATLLDHAWRPAGYHALLWDGSARNGALAPSGIYFSRLISSEGVITRRILRLN